MYQSLIHEYTLGLIVIAIIVCIVVISTIWVLFVYKARHPSSNLINNDDNKSLESSNSKDSGTGESTKRSQELLYNECKSYYIYEKHLNYFTYTLFLFFSSECLSKIEQ